MINEFEKLLPSQKDDIEKAKKELPFGILLDIANAINHKYDKKITARVSESYQVRQSSNREEVKENLIMALYIQAPIGKGYLYRLLEIEQTTPTAYPVKVSVFQNNSSVLGTFKKHSTLHEALVSFMQSQFTKMLLINLLAQVDLYKESQEKSYNIAK